MLDQPPRTAQIVEYPAESAPRLLVVVDTEEEFPWSLPHSRENTSVAAMGDLKLGQHIFNDYGVQPTYVIDFPVASQAEGFEPLMEIVARGECSVGAHLHPWVTPPHEEAVIPANTFPGNLSYELEEQKLTVLTEEIGRNFSRPTIYKAGRYGVGDNTASILERLGYSVDLSPTPGYSYSRESGPDFSRYPASPYLFGSQNQMLCIPCTGGFTGLLRDYGRNLYPFVASPFGTRFKLGGVSSRLGLLERIRLSPEGFSLHDMKKITHTLIDLGVRTFTLSYHSPTLRPGCTPYVNDVTQLDTFLTTIRDYLEFFFSELKGVAATPERIHLDVKAGELA